MPTPPVESPVEQPAAPFGVSAGESEDKEIADGGAGHDVIHARNGRYTDVRCGTGRDRVYADLGDKIEWRGQQGTKGCERVNNHDFGRKRG